jgi:hypothetical protein
LAGRGQVFQPPALRLSAESARFSCVFRGFSRLLLITKKSLREALEPSRVASYNAATSRFALARQSIPSDT